MTFVISSWATIRSAGSVVLWYQVSQLIRCIISQVFFTSMSALTRVHQYQWITSSSKESTPWLKSNCLAKTCCAKMQTPSPKLQFTGGKAEAWLTEDNLVKNCGSGNEEDESQLGHQPEAGQWQTGLEELLCCPICQLARRIVMMMMMMMFDQKSKLPAPVWCVYLPN